MSYFNIVAATSENTVVTEYIPEPRTADAYQSEAELEKEFIRRLCELGYEYLTINKENNLIDNLRKQLEKLNSYTFTDSEWKRFFEEYIANANEGIVEKTKTIQEDHVKTLKRDDGTSKNITLIDKKNIHNNFLQVINQYEVDTGKRQNRYDVTMLVNGFPLVHIELKRRGMPIREAFNQKTYRNERTYSYNVLTNVSEVAESKRREQVQDIKQKQSVSGFNSIFAVSLVQAAKLYYEEFMRQMTDSPEKALKIAVIYSYGANEEDPDGILDEENPENTSALDSTARDFLERAISDYNRQFNTNYDTSSDKFQSYYKDVSLRMKNKELDMLIVVNMFLTGFDATTLNTLWVDKNLKMHGLIQAYSRTNRILNSIKTFGNIVCFRALQKRTDAAISLFGDKEAGGIVTLKSFDDYYNGYDDSKGKHIEGYVDMIDRLLKEFPLDEPQIIGEERQKEFIALLGAILRMRNLLVSFDEFQSKEIISDRDFQDYLGRYQDLHDEWNERRKRGDSTDIDDDIVFEIELIKQLEINIDYILMLVAQYHDSHCMDKEVLITIRKAVDASPELRSKKDLIENFIAGINELCVG